MTMDIYSHVLPTMQREVMDRLNQEFSIEEGDILVEGMKKVEMRKTMRVVVYLLMLKLVMVVAPGGGI